MKSKLLALAMTVFGLGMSQAQASQPLVVIALAKVKPGTEATFKSAVNTIIAPTRKEKGAISFVFHLSTEKEGEYAFYEQWESEADLDAHLKSEHMTRFFSQVGGVFEPGYPKIMRFRAVK